MCMHVIIKCSGKQNLWLFLLLTFMFIATGSENNLDYPKTVRNIPCLHNGTSQLGSNVTINALIVGFVTLQVKDEVTEEVYLEYSVGITRPPPAIQDQVSSWANLSYSCRFSVFLC